MLRDNNLLLIYKYWVMLHKDNDTKYKRLEIFPAFILKTAINQGKTTFRVLPFAIVSTALSSQTGVSP